MLFDSLQPIIGLEIHAQLATKTKLFCACANTNAADAVAICPICTGHPGTLPQLNGEAFALAIRMALALKCTVNDPVFFDRKHYFYPDLPKGYQISQFDVPIGQHGTLMVEAPNREAFTVRIHRIHLEEDAAKNTHTEQATRVDYRRGGVPLVEMVTEPDIRSMEEAKLFLQELQRLLRFAGVSAADMEKGHMRCDANISLRPLKNDGSLPTDAFYAKTEVKNMNSFRAVERAIAFEIERQSKLWEAGTPPETTTTRAWNGATQETVLMRTKEAAADYRYMREPDLPAMQTAGVASEQIAHAARTPAAARERLVREYALAPAAAWTLAETPASAAFTEQALDEALTWLVSRTSATDETVREEYGALLGKTASTWLATKWRGAAEKAGVNTESFPVSATHMGSFLGLLVHKDLSPNAALPVLEQLATTNSDPETLAQSLGVLGGGNTGDDLENTLQQVLSSFPQQVAEYKAGKQTLLPFFIGQAMKQTKGTADAGAVREGLLKLLVV